MTAIMTLDQLTTGHTATITGVVDNAPTPVQRRLADLGFTPGSTITLLRRAPLGDPFMFHIRDYTMCLRRHEASLITITTDMKNT